MTPPEDPFDLWRKRHTTGDFPAFFAEFEKEFARMQGMINKVMEDAMKHAQSPQRGEPFVYGFSMRVGKDGVPQIQPFGSSVPHAVPGLGTPAGTPSIEEAAREPLTDVLEGDREVAVTIELPGVEKGDVQLHVAEEVVTVRVEKGRRYHKAIQLPAKVIPSSAKATFKNGILDVTLQRKQERADPGHRVSIE